MVRITAKRKSESTLPVTKSKLHKVSTQDDSDSAYDDELGDNLFVDEQSIIGRHIKKPKTRKSEPVRIVKADEYAEDEGRMESQQFLALVEIESMKKRMAGKAAAQYLDQFTQRLAQSEQALREQLQGLNTAALKQDEQFLERFSEAFRASRPVAPTAEEDRLKTKGPQDQAFATLHKQSRALTTAARDIIEKFEMANKLTTEVETSGLLDNDWEGEDEEATKVLAIGCDVGIRKYESLLNASAQLATDEEAVSLADMIYKKDDTLISNAWGRIAKKQEKSSKKLLKSFAVETV